MLTKEWWSKNIGGIFLSAFCGIALYAASAYITNAVSREMKNYVPTSVWTQWAQERGEWRGSVDAQLKSLTSMRSELQQQLATLDKKQDVQSTKLEGKVDNLTSVTIELRDELRKHTQKP